MYLRLLIFTITKRKQTKSKVLLCTRDNYQSTIQERYTKRWWTWKETEHMVYLDIMTMQYDVGMWEKANERVNERTSKISVNWTVSLSWYAITLLLLFDKTKINMDKNNTRLALAHSYLNQSTHKRTINWTRCLK